MGTRAFAGKRKQIDDTNQGENKKKRPKVEVKAPDENKISNKFNLTIELPSEEKRKITPLPGYLPCYVVNYFPDEIFKKYKVIKDNNDDNKLGPNFYYKIMDIETNKFYFMKISLLKRGYRNEYYIYDKINNGHRNIINVVYKFRTDKFTVIITPWYDRDLFDYIQVGDLPEKHIKNIFVKITDALNYLLKLGFLYTDLKCENILIGDDYEPVLIDMGLYINVSPETAHDTFIVSGSFCTFDYSTPESITHHKYSQKTITWELGFILYLMIKKSYPFNIKEFYDMITANPRLVNNYKEYVKFRQKIPDKGCYFVDLMEGLLNVNPGERYSLDDVVKHKWCN
jgi:serine/threonine protein kinase